MSAQDVDPSSEFTPVAEMAYANAPAPAPTSFANELEERKYLIQKINEKRADDELEERKKLIGEINEYRSGVRWAKEKTPSQKVLDIGGRALSWAPGLVQTAIQEPIEGAYNLATGQPQPPWAEDFKNAFRGVAPSAIDRLKRHGVSDDVALPAGFTADMLSSLPGLGILSGIGKSPKMAGLIPLVAREGIGKFSRGLEALQAALPGPAKVALNPLGEMMGGAGRTSMNQALSDAENRAIRSTGTSLNPAQVAAEEGIIASSPQGVLDQSKAAFQKLQGRRNEINQMYATSPNTQIPAGDVLNQPILQIQKSFNNKAYDRNAIERVLDDVQRQIQPFVEKAEMLPTKALTLEDLDQLRKLAEKNSLIYRGMEDGAKVNPAFLQGYPSPKNAMDTWELSRTAWQRLGQSARKNTEMALSHLGGENLAAEYQTIAKKQQALTHITDAVREGLPQPGGGVLPQALKPSSWGPALAPAGITALTTHSPQLTAMAAALGLVGRSTTAATGMGALLQSPASNTIANAVQRDRPKLLGKDEGESNDPDFNPWSLDNYRPDFLNRNPGGKK